MPFFCRCSRISLVFALGIGLVAGHRLAARELPASATREVDFAKDVFPLIKANCISCHGAEQQEGGLRLDAKKRALEGGDRGAAIVPGESGVSRLIQLVAGLDDEIGIMPPEGEGTPLTAEQVGILRAWIDQGAKWPDDLSGAAAASHWAFEPLRRPAVPRVAAAAWARNPIDAFVLARLEQEGTAPSDPADSETLIRRLYLDLLGIPPSPGDVAEFLSDTRPGAYRRLVDRVLASAHFGERWGRHWLDLARYADSDGYEKDNARPFAWRYRDWVIDALNADLPFDRFSIAQIAGDMLPSTSVENRVASGFHRNTLHNTEGGTDPEEDRVKKTVDRTNTSGTIWLGLTLGCAQCHSHKYDPITQREYYSMFAFFNSIDEADVAAPLPSELDDHERAKVAYEAEHAKHRAAIQAYEREKLADAQAAWEAAALNSQTPWTVLQADELRSRNGATLETKGDHSVLASGPNVTSDQYTFISDTALESVSAFRLEALPDDSLPKNGPGRAENGNFVLTTLKVTAEPLAPGTAAAASAVWKSAHADFSQNDWEVSLAINENPDDGWAVSPRMGQRHVAVFSLEQPVGFAGGTRLTISLEQKYQGAGPHNLGRFRLYATAAPPPHQLDDLPATVAAALRQEAKERSSQQRQVLADYYAAVDPELTRLKAEEAAHAKRAPQLSPTKAQAVNERGEYRPAHLLIRGDFLSPGDPVEARTPAVLPEIKPTAERANRLDLARWLFRDDNPLTARVTVNRIWQRYFGRGIVASSDDFGTQGEPPSHPQLLDWLACELISSGWSLKHIHNLIVNSATYRQTSAMRPDLVERDPDNILLARQSRYRVEAEIVRDLALAASGLLDTRIGGSSVYPPQPAEHSELTYANSAKWATSKAGDAHRRGLYTFFRRTSPYPMLMTFDAPDSNECTAQRSRSNTPLQALTLWNDRVFFECARALGRRIVTEAPAAETVSETTAQRAMHAFRLCLARDPAPAELDAVVALFKTQMAACEPDGGIAETINGEGPLPATAAPGELAGWIMVARTLLNLDEFISKE